MCYFIRETITLVTFLFLNQLLIQAQCVQSHQIRTSTGDTSLVLTCPSDGRTDEIAFQTDADSEQYLYILTNENGLIIDIRTNGRIDFERANQDLIKVYGVAYEGTSTVSIGQMLDGTVLADSCFTLSSNFIAVRKTIPDAGVISSNGATSLSFCPDDPTLGRIALQHSGDTSTQYAYLLVDDNDVILQFSTNTALLLNGLEEANYRIYGMAYRGDLINRVGEKLRSGYLASDCYSLSSNFVTLALTQPPSNSISLIGSDRDTMLICESLRTIEFKHSIDTIASNYAYIVQDETGLVINILENINQLDANTLPQGILQVTGVAYTNSLAVKIGDSQSSATIAKNCFTLSNNSIILIKNALEIGQIKTSGGATSITICGSSVVDVLAETQSEGAIVYILTDSNGTISAIQTSNSFGLRSFGVTRRVYAATYTGELLLQVGDELTINPISTGCYDLSDNFVQINSITPVGGNIAFRGGGTSSYNCPSVFTEKPFWVASNSTNPDLTYSFLLINEANVLRAISENGFFLMTEDETGQFKVRGISHLDTLDLNVGDTLSANTIYSSECYELSENIINIDWTEPSAGEVTTMEGTTTAFICPNTPSSIPLKHSSAIGDYYSYILVDTANQILTYAEDILAIDSLSIGAYHIFGIAYTGELSVTVGENLFDSSLSTGCFNISEKSITLQVQAPTATLVATSEFEETLSFCSNSEAARMIKVLNTSDANTNYAYLLTDENNHLIAISSGDSVSIAGNLTGNLRIWGVSYTGNIVAEIGADVTRVALSDQCEELSMNAIEIELKRAKSVRIQTFQQEEQIAICYGDGQADYIGFYAMEEIEENFKFVITDANDVIIQLLNGNIQNFERIGPSIVKVWGVQYTGTFTGRIGQNVLSSNLSTDCFSVSENHITIIRSRLESGIVEVNGNNSSVGLCAALGTSQYFELNRVGASAAQYSYVVTDRKNEVLAITQDAMIDLGQFNKNVLIVQGIAHQSDLLLTVGDNLSTSSIAIGCYEWAKNEVIVERQLVDGGSVSDITGAAEITICPNDDLPDIVVLRNNSLSSQDYRYIVTDTTNVILALPNGILQNFTHFDEGQYRIYGISYAANLALTIGDTLTNRVEADACYSFSDNFLSVYKTTPSIDKITTADGATSVITFVGDGIADSLQFQVSGVSESDNPLLIVTNTQNVIVGLSEGSYDFDIHSIGFYRVYGAVYTGELNLKIGDLFDATVVATGCADVAENYVQIICAPATRNRSYAVQDQYPAIELFPNPVQKTSQVSYWSAESAWIQLQIVDATGRIILQQKQLAQAGNNTWAIDLGTLKTGWYVLKITDAMNIKALPFSKVR